MVRSLLIALIALTSPASAQSGARTITNAFRPGDESVWVFESAGARIGQHAARYLGRDDRAGVLAHHFQGSLRLKLEHLGAVEMRSTADLWTDDLGHPIRFVQQARVGDAYSRIEVEPAGDKSKARIVQGTTPREVTVKIDAAAYLLANNFVSHLEILGAVLPLAADAKVQLFSGTSLQGLGYTLKYKGKFEDEVRGVPRRGEVYEDSLGETLRFAGGRLIDVEIAAAKLVIRRSDERAEPIAIQPPEIRQASAAFDATDVIIEHGDARIAGTVTKKKGAEGRLPAVFFISGSGPQDRNGYASGIDLGTHEILDRLTEQGFLVLRVDDRSAGESSRLPPDASYMDLVADARACVDHLSKRADVDPKRIVLIGHSEGAETAPILVAERPDIAAIVLMAPPGRPIQEVIADQNRLALENQGLAKDEVEAQMKGVRAFLKRLASDEPIDPETLSAEERTTLANRAWFQSHARQDPIANIRKVRCPILILQGGKDFQVSPELDARALETALADAKHPDHELRVFADLDHVFKKTPGAKSELADYWKSRPVDPAFLETLKEWLNKRLKPDGG